MWRRATWLFSNNIFILSHFAQKLNKSFPSAYKTLRVTFETVGYSYTLRNKIIAVRVFANGLGDLGSIPGRVIPKTQIMVLDASLLNTQHYKVRIKGKVGQSREEVAPSLHLGVVAIEKGAFGSPSTMVANFTYLYRIVVYNIIIYDYILFMFYKMLLLYLICIC